MSSPAGTASSSSPLKKLGTPAKSEYGKATKSFSSPFDSTPSQSNYSLRSQRRLNNSFQNKENSSGTPIQKIKAELMTPDVTGAKDTSGCCQQQNESLSGHTRQWLHPRLSDDSFMKEGLEKLSDYRASLTIDYQASRLDVSRCCSQRLNVTQCDTAEMQWRANFRTLNAEMRQLKREHESTVEKMKSQMSSLETEVRRLKEERANKDGGMKELAHLNKTLEAELHSKIEEQGKMEDNFKENLDGMESRMRAAEQLAMEERSKHLEVVEMMIEEKNRHPSVDQDTLLLLEEKVSCLKKAFTDVKEYVRGIPSVVCDMIQSTSFQMQKAIHETSRMNQDLVKRYAREIQLRKRYHNQLVELRGNIRVFCRVRPSNSGDECLTFDPHDDGIIRVQHKGRSQVFEFDKVFNDKVTQSQIFEELSDLIRSVLDGFNVCIFAYGQTGSGKTHTMEGPAHDPGINQRALHFLYEQTQALNWNYSIQASVLEVYNETIRDLLKPDGHPKLEVKLQADGHLSVPGLVKVPVSSLEEANRVFQMGRENRAIEVTNMNEHSSRSHCLLRISVSGVNSLTGNKCQGQLNLVDLAGSERVARSLAEGPRLKEAQNINKSLASLGDVINALKNKHTHVPYRNSKLTYLLQDSLSGDSKTLMILQASPEEVDVSETVCTLTFGQRVRSAELGTSTHKGTPTSMRRAVSHDTPYASPTPKKKRKL